MGKAASCSKATMPSPWEGTVWDASFSQHALMPVEWIEDLWQRKNGALISSDTRRASPFSAYFLSSASLECKACTTLLEIAYVGAFGQILCALANLFDCASAIVAQPLAHQI